MSGAALTIIGEYSYFLWDQTQSRVDSAVAVAVDLYKGSLNCNAPIQAVNAVFRDNKFDEDHQAFAQKLIQIALENQLCRSNPNG
jgi:hypothetical protein